MECPITTALVGLMGGLLGVFCGNRLALGRDGENRRRAFLNHLAVVKSGVSVVDNDSFAAWFTKSKPDLAGICAEVRKDIRWWKRKEFNAACEAYARAQRPDIQDFDTNASPQLAMRQMTYGKGRDLMRAIISRLESCA